MIWYFSTATSTSQEEHVADMDGYIELYSGDTSPEWDTYVDDAYDASVDDKVDIFACMEDEVVELNLLPPFSSPVYDTHDKEEVVIHDLLKIGFLN